ncbi:MAG: hypothetical protein E7Z64_03235 [Thermoplasmata archaeon]|nr:hypothetical protein [Thermoplasmata archaeon]
MAIKLSEIADAIDMNCEAYADLTTGEVILILDGIDEIELDEEHDIRPIFFEYNVGYKAMEEFIESLGDDSRTDPLWRAISGQGAFGRFRTAIDILDMEKEWYSFKEEYYFRKAKAWCEDEGIDYSE